jgi:hypothetical protein
MKLNLIEFIKYTQKNRIFTNLPYLQKMTLNVSSV